MFDWGDGHYERTATTLLSVSDEVVAHIAPTTGTRIADVGCGTGNGALAAARRGARVTGIDPAERLLSVASERAAHEGLVVDWRAGSGGALPLGDHSQDAAIAIFSIIFAPNAHDCIRELRRVVRPGGRIVFTTWMAEGPLNDSYEAMMRVASEVRPPSDESADEASPSEELLWGDGNWLSKMWPGVDLTLVRRTHRMTAPSAAAWFEDQETNHPAWRAMRRGLADIEGAWARVKEASVQVLAAASAPGVEGWAIDSHYWLVDVTLPDAG